MPKPNLEFSSGMKNLDDVLQGILPGDNVVLQVDDLDEYIPFVHKFVRNLNKEDKPLVYFRFAQHEFLIPNDVHATIIELRPERGFEKFLSQIIKTIEIIKKPPRRIHVLRTINLNSKSKKRPPIIDKK